MDEVTQEDLELLKKIKEVGGTIEERPGKLVDDWTLLKEQYTEALADIEEIKNEANSIGSKLALTFGIKVPALGVNTPPPESYPFEVDTPTEDNPIQTSTPVTQSVAQIREDSKISGQDEQNFGASIARSLQAAMNSVSNKR